MTITSPQGTNIPSNDFFRREYPLTTNNTAITSTNDPTLSRADSIAAAIRQGVGEAIVPRPVRRNNPRRRVQRAQADNQQLFNNSSPSVVFPNPEQDPALYDHITFLYEDGHGNTGTFLFLPLAKISGDGPSLSIDTPKSPGVNGYPIISKGYNNAKLRIKFELWTPEQMDQYWRVLDIFQPILNPLAQRSIRVLNPIINALKVDRIVVTKLSPLTHDDSRPGLWSFEIECIQWIRPNTRNTTHRIQSPNTTPPPTVAPANGVGSTQDTRPSTNISPP